MIQAAAILACILLAGLAIFQSLLIGGAPLGHLAWGGSHRVLPTRLRIGSLVSVVLYMLFALIILEASGIISVIPNDTISDIGIWVLTIYFGIGTVMNGVSRSKPERLVMTPVAATLGVLCLLIALQ